MQQLSAIFFFALHTPGSTPFLFPVPEQVSSYLSHSGYLSTSLSSLFTPFSCYLRPYLPFSNHLNFFPTLLSLRLQITSPPVTLPHGYFWPRCTHGKHLLSRHQAWAPSNPRQLYLLQPYPHRQADILQTHQPLHRQRGHNKSLENCLPSRSQTSKPKHLLLLL